MNAMSDNRDWFNKSEAQGQKPKRLRLLWFLLPVAVLVIGGLLTMHSKAASETKVAQTTDTLAQQHVSVVHPERGDASTQISLPGTTQAYIESPLNARTNGYIKTWTKDIGAYAKAGELLALIETPEIDRQLMQAQAVLTQAEANLKLARITQTRYQTLLPSRSVAQQDVDSANQNVAMLTASGQAAAADVQRLQQLQQFERVIAPFDGIVTARNIDIGDLINAGSGGAGTEMFRMARIDILRVFINVPEDYSGSVKPGSAGKLTIASLPGKEFPAKVTRFSHAVDPASRTMRVELDVPNKDGALTPGAFASASFDLRTPVRPMVLPANTLLFQENGMQVGVVGSDHKVQLRNVIVGRDFGTSVEIVSGIAPSDAVIANPSDSLTAGTEVAVTDSKDKAGA